MRGCAVFDLGCRDGAWNVRVASLLLWRRYVDEKKKKLVGGGCDVALVWRLEKVW